MAFQGDSIFWVEVEKIVANPYQPRREFDEVKLKELAESVRMYGILQPLTVTRHEVQGDDGSFRSEYELIAGERRLRASKLAGLLQVPVIIREGEESEQEKLELAIIENLQREDLNAVDRALAFRQLADVFGLSHSQVAKKVGRSREYVSNSIRLLGLPDYMLNSLRSADISEGHARTLLMLNDRPEEQDTVFREILLKKLSVRDVERIARGIAVEKTRRKDNVDTDLLELERQFTETLGTRVSIVKTEFGGKMTIDYFSQDDLEAILLKMRDEAKQMNHELPASGENRERIELEEDKETKNALEKLTDSTGLKSIVDKSEISGESNKNSKPVTISQPEINVPIIPEPTLPKVAENIPLPVVGKTEETVDHFPTIPPKPHTTNSPLRDQLAALLGSHNVSKTQTTPAPTPNTKDNQSKTIPKSESQPETKNQDKLTSEKSDDDSNLYSMNGFGV